MLERENNELREQLSTLTFDNSIKQNILDRLNENEVVTENDNETETEKKIDTPVFDTDFSLSQAGNCHKPSLWVKFKSVSQLKCVKFLTLRKFQSRSGTYNLNSQRKTQNSLTSYTFLEK